MAIKKYTKEEEDLILNDEYSISDLARKLKRSYAAISFKKGQLIKRQMSLEKKQNSTKENVTVKKELINSFEVISSQMITFTQAKVKIGGYIVSGTFTISSE